VVSLLSAERYSDKFDHIASPLPELSESVVGFPFMISGLGALAGLVAAALAVRTRMKGRRWSSAASCSQIARSRATCAASS
jgi:hypothetical protein